MSGDLGVVQWTRAIVTVVALSMAIIALLTRAVQWTYPKISIRIATIVTVS